MSCLDLIFVKVFSFTIWCPDIYCSQHHLLKSLFLFQYMIFDKFVKKKKSGGYSCLGLFLGSIFYCVGYISVFVPELDYFVTMAL